MLDDSNTALSAAQEAISRTYDEGNAKDLVTITRTITYTGIRWWVASTLARSLQNGSHQFGVGGTISVTTGEMTVESKA
jgi:hypothetical protein